MSETKTCDSRKFHAPLLDAEIQKRLIDRYWAERGMNAGTRIERLGENYYVVRSSMVNGMPAAE